MTGITPITPGTPFLSVSTFLNYGGRTGTTTAFALNAAFLIAQEEVERHIGSLIQPTNCTGTFLWATNVPVQLDYGYVHYVSSVQVTSTQNILYTYNNDDLQRSARIRDAKRGLIDILLNPLIYRTTTYPYSIPTPYQITIGYNAGIPTDISSRNDFTWALVQAAQLVLNEMDTTGFLANEAPGGIGIQEFMNQLYSEKRVALGHSIFGSSPVAQQITRILAKFRTRPVARFH